MRQIGYVLSGCDQRRISFVVMENAKVYVNSYYFINHPLSLIGEFNPVLLRVYKIAPYNPEMTVGSFGPIAGKKGEKAYYGKRLEYLVAWAEVLGYISLEGKWRRLECSPNTWDSVYEPTNDELENFFVRLSSRSSSDRTDFPITVGNHRGLKMPFHIDLNAVAKGHMFVAGMTRSGKSTFVLNLIAKALEHNPKPRLIVFDRRCEYRLLMKYGAVMFPYYRFVPKAELISPRLVASRLGLNPNRSEGRLLCEALNSIKAEGIELTVENVFKRSVELSPYLLSRSRDSVLARIKWALRERGANMFTEDHKPLNIIDMLYEKPAVIVDFSVDTNIEDQQLAAKYLVKSVVNYAIKHRKAGDFAAIFVIEEAQYFIPEIGLKIEVGNPEKTGVDKQIIEAISQAGGYNVGFIIVTQRPAYISKCLSGNMIVQLYNGEVITVKELYRRLRENSGLVLRLDDEIVVYPKDNVQLSTLSKDLSCVNTRLIAISRRRGSRNLLRLKTFDGYVLECSPEHRVYLIGEDGKLVEREAKSLKPGEQLLLVHPVTQSSQPNFNNLTEESITSTHKAYRLRERFDATLKPYDGNWNRAIEAVYESTGASHFTIGKRLQILQKPLGYKLNLTENAYMGGNATSTRTIADEATPELGEFLGLMISGGSNTLIGSSYKIRFTSRSSDVLNRFKHLCNSLFGVSPEEDPKHIVLKVHSKGLMKILGCLGHKVLTRAEGRVVPPCVQKGSDDVVSAFLRGLFECNGYVSLKNRRIGFTATSRELAYQVLFLMFRLGFKPKLAIKPTCHEDKPHRLVEVSILDDDGILTFHKRIGFISKDKRAKLDRLVSMVKHNRCRKKHDYVSLSLDLLSNAIMKTFGQHKHHNLWYEVLKRGGRLRKMCGVLSKATEGESESLKLLKRIVDAPISLSTIKEIEEFPVEETYDLETEDKSLIAGGAPFLVHNSVISQCNTIAAFRLMAGNDQEAIIKYSEYGSERMRDYLPGLADHEALIWGMASTVPFPVTVEVDVKDYPSKTGVTASVAWKRMGFKAVEAKTET